MGTKVKRSSVKWPGGIFSKKGYFYKITFDNPISVDYIFFNFAKGDSYLPEGNLNIYFRNNDKGINDIKVELKGSKKIVNHKKDYEGREFNKKIKVNMIWVEIYEDETVISGFLKKGKEKKPVF